MERGVWITREEIVALPMQGPAWDALKARADLPAGTPNLSDQDQNNNVYVMAKALVYARTGIEAYRTEVRQQCMAAINTERTAPDVLPLAREVAAYVISADLVGLTSGEEATFKTWLAVARDENLGGRTLRTAQADRPNNWGTNAGASRAAIDVYLDDARDLARCAQIFKGYLGDREAHAGFTYGADLSWQADPLFPVGVNPIGTTIGGVSVDGALPDDMRRGGAFQTPPPQTNYPWEALQGALVLATILARQGYDTWAWGDDALWRATYFLFSLDARYSGWAAVGDDAWLPWIVNWAYGSSFGATAPARPGKNCGWTDWTHDRNTRGYHMNAVTMTLACPLDGQLMTMKVVTHRGDPVADPHVHIQAPKQPVVCAGGHTWDIKIDMTLYKRA